MYTLIVSLLFGLAFTYFATQNTGPVTIHLANSNWSGVPLYWAIFGALLIGVVIAALISIAEAIASFRFGDQRKTSTLTHHQQEKINELSTEVKNLQIQNDKLHTELDKAQKDSPFYQPQPSVIDRLKTRMAM
jgi:uncharacterized integral membrane protein